MLQLLFLSTVLLIGTVLAQKTFDIGDGDIPDQYSECVNDESVRQLTASVNKLLLPSCRTEEAIKPKTTLKLTKIGNAYYYISNNSVSWGTAFRFCVKNNMKLVSPDTDAKIREIVDFLKANGYTTVGADPDSYWTSGIDFGLENSFYWASTGDLIDSTEISWWPGHPIKSENSKTEGTQHTVLFNHFFNDTYRSTFRYTIFTRWSSWPYKFICEK